eukprot:scaffold80233_cov92-Phaeocystis_antarctica.AAC.2
MVPPGGHVDTSDTLSFIYEYDNAISGAMQTVRLAFHQKVVCLPNIMAFKRTQCNNLPVRSAPPPFPSARAALAPPGVWHCERRRKRLGSQAPAAAPCRRPQP